MSLQHVPVMLEQAIKELKIKPGGRYIDCTVGTGGHSSEILRRSSPGGQLLGFDADKSPSGRPFREKLKDPEDEMFGPFNGFLRTMTDKKGDRLKDYPPLKLAIANRSGKTLLTIGPREGSEERTEADAF